MTMVIGIAGLDEAGKSTYAGQLANLLGGAIVTNFAIHLRKTYSELNGVSLSQLLQKPTDADIRAKLMAYSKLVKRINGNDYWVRKADNMLAQTNWSMPVIFDDVRFMVEAQYILSKGGTLIGLSGGNQASSRYQLDSIWPLLDYCDVEASTVAQELLGL